MASAEPSGEPASATPDLKALDRQVEPLFIPPANWDTQAVSCGNMQVKLDPQQNKAEFDEVTAFFRRTADPDERFRVKKIFRVQNMEQLVQFRAQRQKVANELQAAGLQNVVERRLWHGTTAEASDKICVQEFNRSFYNRRHGNDYGEGSYFHTSPSVAISLSDMIPEATIILSKVITGNYIEGEETITRVNLPEGCHSTVNDEENPVMFAVYHDAAAYPEYVVKASYRNCP